MVVCYGRFGIFANVALFTNLVLIMAMLSLLQATLTLPGIAGIVLTVGMAVDANVLIFERIREETGHGRTAFNAVEIRLQAGHDDDSRRQHHDRGCGFPAVLPRLGPGQGIRRDPGHRPSSPRCSRRSC